MAAAEVGVPLPVDPRGVVGHLLEPLLLDDDAELLKGQPGLRDSRLDAPTTLGRAEVRWAFPAIAELALGVALRVPHGAPLVEHDLRLVARDPLQPEGLSVHHLAHLAHHGAAIQAP